jgi:hypothetical protein
MAKPKRTFSADIGQKSTGTAGPDQIEYDLDNLFAALDPADTFKDGTSGGINTENIRDNAITTLKIADGQVTPAKLEQEYYTKVEIDTKRLKDPVATTNDLPTSGNATGDMRVVLSGPALYIWDGSQWLLVGDTVVSDHSSLTDLEDWNDHMQYTLMAFFNMGGL